MYLTLGTEEVVNLETTDTDKKAYKACFLIEG